jgi:hypothetical protein
MNLMLVRKFSSSFLDNILQAGIQGLDTRLQKPLNRQSDVLHMTSYSSPTKEHTISIDKANEQAQCTLLSL